MHIMLLFGVCEYMLNCFLKMSVQRAIQTYMPEKVYFIHRFLPEMTMNDFSVIATLQKSKGHDDCPQQTIQEEQKAQSFSLEKNCTLSLV